MIEKIRVSCNDGESSRDGILEDIRKVGGVESAKVILSLANEVIAILVDVVPGAKIDDVIAALKKLTVVSEAKAQKPNKHIDKHIM